MRYIVLITTLLAVGNVWAAQGGKGNSFATRVATLEALVQAQASTIDGLTARLAMLEGQITTLQGQAHARYTDGEAIAAANVAGAISSHKEDPNAHHAPTPVADPQNVLSLFTRDGNELYLDHSNLHIRNGLNATDATPNGLGNLIIGYNEQRATILGDAPRNGSHNVVIGTGHGYTSYGGLVSGQANTISGPYASVSGGIFNTASGYSSSVSGGVQNRAEGEATSVSGGSGNTADADESHPDTHNDSDVVSAANTAIMSMARNVKG